MRGGTGGAKHARTLLPPTHSPAAPTRAALLAQVCALAWTLALPVLQPNLRRGVKGCGGATFNADDVLYTFARAKSVSGSAPISWFLSNVASIAGFTPAVFGDAEAKKLGNEVTKIDDYTVTIKQSAPNKLMLPVLTIFGI